MFLCVLQVMRGYFPSILSLAQGLLRSTDCCVVPFGGHIYKQAFTAFDSYCQQVRRLITPANISLWRICNAFLHSIVITAKRITIKPEVWINVCVCVRGGVVWTAVPSRRYFQIMPSVCDRPLIHHAPENKAFIWCGMNDIKALCACRKWWAPWSHTCAVVWMERWTWLWSCCASWYPRNPQRWHSTLFLLR